ncbi:MAG: hypothetical protein V3R81_01275 [Gammaproteobacteria bacterium]
MSRAIRSSIMVYPGQSARLQAIAARLGLYQTRGVGAGTIGSISRLMQTLAEGEVIATRADAAKTRRALEGIAARINVPEGQNE